tara:strand:+ start:183 stop:563 length:381 start_codon:yes stop_codon:yes gene_type:complete
MRKITVLVLVLLVGCTTDKENLPKPIEAATPTTIVEPVTIKKVRLDIDNQYIVSTSTCSSSGLYLDSSPSDRWYEYELSEGDTLKVASFNSALLGSPIINVFVDDSLIHTEAGAIDGSISYTYINN